MCATSSRMHRRASFIATALLAGCATPSLYDTPPAVQASAEWTDSDTMDVSQAELGAWWASLGDPTLDRLVEAALNDNLDIRQAEARLAEARAAYDDAVGARAPTVDANASVTGRRQSLNGALPLASIPGSERDQLLFKPNFDASWELDLFGRLARRVEAADARLGASSEDARDLRISIAAEVVRSYVTLRGAQRERAALARSVETLRRTADIARVRADLGDIPAGDLHLAEAQYAEASAGLPGLDAQIRASAFALSLLTGQAPEAELALSESTAPDLTLTLLPIGERADLLRRRPDIRAAERRLAAAFADVGAARAEWFPKLTITALGGFEALSDASLLSSDSFEASITPLISWRLLDGGRVRAQIRGAQARQEQAALAYEAAVIEALSDAEEALSTYRESLETARRRRLAREGYSRAYDFSRLRFEEGDIALAELLDTERRLRNAERGDAQAQTAAATNLAALYKALGGGWDIQTDASPNQLTGRTP